MSGNDTTQKCGMVAVLGLPNAGKSTLINRIVGSKVSIVSPKVQTTRTRILGIALSGASQIVLIDTPGIFGPRKTLERAMVAAAWDSVDGADVVIHLIDAKNKGAVEKALEISERLKKDKKNILVLNKVDTVQKEALLNLASALNENFSYDATFMISGLKGHGVKDLLSYLEGAVPEGPWHFPEDQISDIPMRFMAAELTREKIFLQLHQELPYAIMVETETWEQFDDGSIKISQIITVDKNSQKAIILGKGGARIKAIGQSARGELESLLETRVHLKLFVKVQANWAERADNYEAMGLHFTG